jgi:hypothetical protein
VNSLLFAVLAVAGSGYFLFRRRNFDLFLVAFGGCLFYFLPLLVGSVPARTEPPSGIPIILPIGVYVLGIGITASVLLSALVFDLLERTPRAIDTNARAGAGLSSWYLLFSIIGLVGAVRSGAILNVDKIDVLRHIGYWFVLFETAAGLAVVDAFRHRKRLQFVAGLALMFVDLIIGFRTMTIMIFIACVLLQLGNKGPVSLWRKLPALGLGVAVLFVAMVIVNPLRYAVLSRVDLAQEVLRPFETIGPLISQTPVSQSPVSQSPEVSSPSKVAADAAAPSIKTPWSSIISPDLWNIEPFVTQAILAEMIRTDFSCSPRNILNALYVIPFAGLVLRAPSSFEDEYKTALFSGYRYGLAGNIWAEAFCRFGYVGVALTLFAFILSLRGFQVLLFKTSGYTVGPAAALSGAFLAFYVHRNDLLFELLLIRRTFMVFAVAWALQYAWSRYVAARPIENGAPT